VIPGLTDQALLAWAGTRRLSALALRGKELAAKPLVPASTALALFVAGVSVPRAQVERMLGARIVDLLVERDVLELGDMVRAKVAILPVVNAVIVCDRWDAADAPERLPWPDDSSYHLVSSLTADRRKHWIDLATGNAFGPLVRPDIADRTTGVDLSARAIRYARLGASLSNRVLEVREGDVATPLGTTAQLVTCNAPIVDDPDQAIWRRADKGFFARLWQAARACVAPGGDVVVHATLDALPMDRTVVTDELPGEVAIVVYTPPGVRAYGVMWWRPDAEPRRVVGYRELTQARPHLDPRDRADVLAGALAPLHAAQV
jgi:hypothetical protein